MGGGEHEQQQRNAVQFTTMHVQQDIRQENVNLQNQQQRLHVHERRDILETLPPLEMPQQPATPVAEAVQEPPELSKREKRKVKQEAKRLEEIRQSQVLWTHANTATQNRIQQATRPEQLQQGTDTFLQKHPEYAGVQVGWGAMKEADAVAMAQRLLDVQRMQTSCPAHYADAGLQPFYNTYRQRMADKAGAYAKNMNACILLKQQASSVRFRRWVSKEAEAQYSAALHQLSLAQIEAARLMREISLIEGALQYYMQEEKLTKPIADYLREDNFLNIRVPVAVREENYTNYAHREDADKVFRPITTKLWPGFTQHQKEAAYVYTGDAYKPLNTALRGQRWDAALQKLFPNTISIEQALHQLHLEGRKETAMEDAKAIEQAIDTSELPINMVLRRGSLPDALAHLLGITEEQLNTADLTALKQHVEGTMVMDKAFMSTGVAEDAGFTYMPVQYKILAPKGTKGLYCEPFSKCGRTSSNKLWDGVATSTIVGNEAEILLQRGTEFVVEEINRTITTTKKGEPMASFSVTLRVVGQSPDELNPPA